MCLSKGKSLGVVLEHKSLGTILEHRSLLQLCLSKEKSLGCVLEQLVILCDYSEIPWKCKRTKLLLNCKRNQYKIVLCLLSLSLSLYLCVMNLICCIQTLYHNLHTTDYDKYLTPRKRNHEKPIQFNPLFLRVFLTFIFSISYSPWMSMSASF